MTVILPVDLEQGRPSHDERFRNSKQEDMNERDKSNEIKTGSSRTDLIIFKRLSRETEVIVWRD